MFGGNMAEAPQNGIKGLTHWRYDLLVGMQVALVSLPLSLGWSWPCAACSAVSGQRGYAAGIPPSNAGA